MGMLWWGNRGQLYSSCLVCNSTAAERCCWYVNGDSDHCDTKAFQETTLSTGEEKLPNPAAEPCQWGCAWAERGTSHGDCQCLHLHKFNCFCSKSKESVVLAKWLKGVTVAVAKANPMDEHAACFGCDFIAFFDKRHGFGFQCMRYRTKNLGYEQLYLSTLWQWDHMGLRIWILEPCWVTETFLFCKGRIFCSALLTIVPWMMVWQGLGERWKRASRHNGLQFFISHLSRWARTRR